MTIRGLLLATAAMAVVLAVSVSAERAEHPAKVSVGFESTTHLMTSFMESRTEAGGVIDINHATREELEELKGVGDAKAAAIVAGRPYCKPEDIARVRGISVNRVSSWGDQICADCDGSGDALPCPVQDDGEDEISPMNELSNGSDVVDSSPPQVRLDPGTLDDLAEENRKRHITTQYDRVSALVLRRGRSFIMKVGSVHHIDVTIRPSGDFWGDTPDVVSWPAEVVSDHIFKIGIPPNAALGEYSVTVTVKGSGEMAQADIIVIANPFASKDDVYMTGADNLGEYVLNTKGLIWQGLVDDREAHVWDYDQFEPNNLWVALRLLRRLSFDDRRDVVAVTRHLSFAINEDVCFGKWGDGSYTTGRPSGGYRCSKSGATKCFSPSHWEGTTELLRVHRGLIEANVHSTRVQFCQCFVYAGVTTTVTRALGIPSRVTTNFQSAHDTNANRAVEKYYEIENGYWNPVEDFPHEGVEDSVWSFHVWNEVFMRRSDLSAFSSRSVSPNGWQVIDATPQEVTPEGIYAMGPASVSLVKRNKDHPYEAEFLISEVNANTNLWVRTAENPEWTFHDSYFTDPFDDLSTPGAYISTKKIGGIDDVEADDLTLAYKDAEPSGPGSPTKDWKPEHMVVSLAEEKVTTSAAASVHSMSTSGASELKQIAGEDFTLELDFGGKIEYGSPLDLGFNFESTRGEPRALKVVFKVTAVTTGGVQMGKAIHLETAEASASNVVHTFSCPADKYAKFFDGGEDSLTVNIVLTLTVDGHAHIHQRRRRVVKDRAERGVVGEVELTHQIIEYDDEDIPYEKKWHDGSGVLGLRKGRSPGLDDAMFSRNTRRRVR